MVGWTLGWKTSPFSPSARWRLARRRCSELAEGRNQHVLSLLTSEEERELDLRNEAREVREKGMRFLSLPIPDRDVPKADSEVRATVEKLDTDLSSGKNVIIHCRQGVGRSGLVAACLLVTRGLSSGAAVDSLTAARGVEIPETSEQRHWIDRYSATLTGAK